MHVSDKHFKKGFKHQASCRHTLNWLPAYNGIILDTKAAQKVTDYSISWIITQTLALISFHNIATQYSPNVRTSDGVALGCHLVVNWSLFSFFSLVCWWETPMIKDDHFILFYFILFYFILFCFILFYFILFYILLNWGVYNWLNACRCWMR